MYINLIIIPFIILLGLLLPDDNKNRKLFIVLVILVFSLESALRSLFLVADAYSYGEWFTIRIRAMSWDEIWSSFVDRYFRQGQEENDFGFLLLMKAFSYLTSSFQVFTFFSQLLFYIPMGIFLFKYSTHNRQLIFAFIFFVALLQVSALGGGRQFLARGCWLMTFMMINEKKYLKGALWLVIGLTMHFSILIVIVAIAFGFLKVKMLKKIHLFTFFILPFVVLFPDQIIVYLGNLAGHERYAAYGQSGFDDSLPTFMLLMEALSILSFIMLKEKTLKTNILLKELYVMLPCLTLTAPLLIANGAMIRLSSYFHMFMMLIAPYAFDEFKDKKTVTFVYVLAVGILSFLTVRDGGLKYYFYWQDYMFN